MDIFEITHKANFTPSFWKIRFSFTVVFPSLSTDRKLLFYLSNANVSTFRLRQYSTSLTMFALQVYLCFFVRSSWQMFSLKLFAMTSRPVSPSW